ncbi:cyclase family protein [Frigidibacter sp. MR17.24]|uniref:cyclase family protein n=1 Tax=Frigidibacter sp. MR17.24 TaxID=3127345 RepID=UPI003012D2EF
MCTACLIEDVKRDMLSRRALFAGAATTAAASIAAGVISARPALAQARGRAIDLTHAYDSDFPTFDGKPGILYEVDKQHATDGYHLFKLTIFEHTGTHIDTPLHFAAGGTSVDALPVENLIAPLCVIDISDRARTDPNATVTPEDVEAWISANGAIPQGACVAMHSGWGAKVGEAAWRNLPDGTMAFPGFSKAATDLLADTGAASIGVDTMSLDPGNSADFAVHYSWLPSGRFGIEGLANLDQLPAAGATIFIGAPKHRGGTGGPARVMALV